MKTNPSSEYGVLQHSAILPGETGKETKPKAWSVKSNVMSSPLVLLTVKLVLKQNWSGLMKMLEVLHCHYVFQWQKKMRWVLVLLSKM